MTVGICGHGMLARSCEICEMIATLADRDSAIERLKAAATTWKERCEASWEHEDGLSRLLQEQIDIKLEVGERMEKAEQAIAARDAEIERLKRKLDLFRQMAEKINSLSSERLGEPLANAILGLLAAIDEASASTTLSDTTPE